MLGKRRRSIRLKEYDYATPGYYFVTICTNQRKPVLSSIKDSDARLTNIGKIVENVWLGLPRYFSDARLDALVIMPDHFHGIIQLLEDRGKPHSLPRLIQNFKSISSRRVHAVRKDLAFPLWQRNYYEHIVRTDKSLNLIRLYIEFNPQLWQQNVSFRDMEMPSLERIAEILEKFQHM